MESCLQQMQWMLPSMNVLNTTKTTNNVIDMYFNPSFLQDKNNMTLKYENKQDDNGMKWTTSCVHGENTIKNILRTERKAFKRSSLKTILCIPKQQQHDIHTSKYDDDDDDDDDDNDNDMMKWTLVLSFTGNSNGNGNTTISTGRIPPCCEIKGLFQKSQLMIQDSCTLAKTLCSLSKRNHLSP